jgi:NAD-dependent deacetylase
MTDETTLTDLAQAVHAARTVAVLTGSGLSADSGVPTFRDAQSGLWAHYRPEDLANPEAFERNPATVWQWYRARRQTLASIAPNEGHRALADLAHTLADLRLITQNVDGLHQEAGHPDVVEFHGNIRLNRCHDEGRAVEVDDAVDTPPPCPHCGGLVRPGVVWFGEAIDAGAIERAKAAAQACDVFLSVGTSAEVHPAAGLADLARRSGARIAEINPDATALSDRVTWTVRDSAARALPQLRQLIRDKHA